MISVPHDVMNEYVAILNSREIPAAQVEYYKKWLRYFYDFYAKDLDTDDKPEKVKLFLEKLRSKGQTPYQCQQAAHAISLYFEMQNKGIQLEMSGEVLSIQQNIIQQSEQLLPISPESTAPISSFPSFKQRQSQYSVPDYEEKSDSPQWDEVISKLADEIKFRHYSRKTLKTYAHWSRQFQRFLKNKPPAELSATDIKKYLTYLAVKCKIAASTQNQAFNSLLFLYRHALKIDFGRHTDIPRAKNHCTFPWFFQNRRLIPL